MKNFLKGSLGILLIIMAVGAIFYWEVYGREKLLFKEVVVLNKDVKQGELITDKMIDRKKIDDTSVISGAILDGRLVVGKAAKQFIPAGVLLVEEYFDEPNLVLEENEYIFKIPLGWLKAFPSSLRRGDQVYFYEVSTGEELLGATEGEIIKEHKEQLENLPVVTATVAYVKDSANREVVTLSDEDRYDGSSKINEIEVIINLDTMNKLSKKIDEGSQFILMYH